ncbi:Alcohol dehydrogenase GroES-like domain-containing protein [Fusarium oxysporum f. sp. albedinis]|nr:Alcohol dehydrogenase GroES-like domain-containing protein [Fusarium oxysporum f. sp. albedinis]
MIIIEGCAQACSKLNQRNEGATQVKHWQLPTPDFSIHSLMGYVSVTLFSYYHSDILEKIPFMLHLYEFASIQIPHQLNQHATSGEPPDIPVLSSSALLFEHKDAESSAKQLYQALQSYQLNSHKLSSHLTFILTPPNTLHRSVIMSMKQPSLSFKSITLSPRIHTILPWMSSQKHPNCRYTNSPNIRCWGKHSQLSLGRYIAYCSFRSRRHCCDASGCIDCVFWVKEDYGCLI